MKLIVVILYYLSVVLGNGGNVESNLIIGEVDNFVYLDQYDICRTDVTLINGETISLYDYVANRGSDVIIEFYPDDTPETYTDNGIKSVINVVDNHHFGLY